MNIYIPLGLSSYTPEAYAYKEFLLQKGWRVEVGCGDRVLNSSVDLNLYFMGMRPFWVGDRSGCHEVHEYHSLSMSPHAKIKNAAKRWLNKKPAGRIFLNGMVRQEFNFNDDIPSICRDMGVDKRLFMHAPKNPEYDLIYCGSIEGRPGLVEEIFRLAKIGLKIIIVGDAHGSVRDRFYGFEGVIFTGRVGRHELPEIYNNARAGLNFTPDIYPFDRQTSTKTLEYCAAGLGVVSNRYRWATHFENERGGRFLWLDELNSKADMDDFDFKTPDVFDLEWSNLLEAAGLDNFLRRCAE